MSSITTLRAPNQTAGPMNEGNTAWLRTTLFDNSNPRVAIPAARLTSVTLTLYSEHLNDTGDRDIINNRAAYDVSPFVDALGYLEFQLTSDDMAILDDDLAVEYHRALLEWDWQSVSSPGTPAVGEHASWEVRIPVRNINAVPLGTP